MISVPSKKHRVSSTFVIPIHVSAVVSIIGVSVFEQKAALVVVRELEKQIGNRLNGVLER